MTKLLERALDSIDEFRRKKNVDWVCLLVGPPGSGKSDLGGYCGIYLESKKGKDFTVSQVANTALELLRLFKNTERYGEVVYDEGMKSLMSRRAMSTENIEQISAFAQLRQSRNLIVFVIVQDLNLVEKNIKSSRANSVFRCVYTRDKNGMPQQGRVKVYGPRKLKQIKIDSQGVVKWPACDFSDTFPDISDTQFWKDYEKLAELQKDDSIQSSLDKLHKKKYGKRDEIEMEQYAFALKSKRKSIQQIQTLLKKKFGHTWSVGTIFNKLKRRKKRKG